MFWPYVSETAENEYKYINLFPRAFPWLFPGGTGDYMMYREKEVSPYDWAKTLLHYYDGRFAKDKFWCFYTLNFCERRRTNSQGSFYVNTWSNEKEKTVDEIAEEIKNGNTQWIEKISFFANNIKGSSNYWRSRCNEVYTWISYHVSKGRGPPNFFMTFSCAEYWWEELQTLIIDRFQCCGLEPPEITDLTKVRLINEFTIITQEFFEKKMDHWLQTVGKTIFKIDHYWLRFEFAFSRGQIHAHLLAICPSFKQVFEQVSRINDDDDKAAYLAEWAEKQLGYTSKVSQQLPENVPHPSSHSFTSIADSDKDRQLDLDNLRTTCHTHTCSAYCKYRQSFSPHITSFLLRNTNNYLFVHL
jgi:hypothetical protein